MIRRVLPLVALALVAGGAAAGSASAVTIDFDDVTAPPAGGSQGYNVNSDYADQGVTFNDLDAYSYPSGFPHSPTNAVQQCVAVEFCQVPIRANFTAGQDAARVWVGYDAALAEPLDVRLIAFDGSGAELGNDPATLPASGSPTPVQTPLALDPPGKTIRRIEVTTASGYTAGLVVDDLGFSVEGPPPPCSPTATQPGIGLSRPQNDLVVQRNLFPLSGFVSDGGAAITNATVSAAGGTPRTYQIYPGLIDADGGGFGIANVGDLLSPGVNDVTVRATNCAGQGQSLARKVTWDPIAPSTQFEQLGRIEVTQAVQGPGNVTPLVAATQTTGKRTFARVYLRLRGGESRIDSVTGTVIARDANDRPLDGPLSVDSLNTVNVEAASTLTDVRSDFSKSLNFELPREWQQQGRIHLELDHLSIEGARTGLGCVACENALPSSGNPAFVTFNTVPPVRIWLVRVPWTASAGATPTVPTQFDIDMLASWLRRAYPTAEVRDTHMFMPAQDGPPGFVDEDDDGVDTSRDGFLCDDVWDELSEWTQSMQAQHANTRYYGVVSDAGGNFMRGCAQIGGRFGAGPAGTRTFGWDNDGAYTDWYGGHEIGHMYDRKHPGMCDETDDDDSFPYPGGLIGSASLDFQGLDAGDSTLGPPMQLYDWRAGWSDVMTYCDNQWISSYTYRGILDNLCDRETANCPNRANLAAPRPRRAPVTLARKNKGRALAVSGSLDLGSGKLSLSQISVLRGLTLTERPRRSDFSIVLSRHDGGSLARYPFTPKLISDQPAGHESAGIDEVVRFAPGTRRIEIRKGGRELLSVPVSAHVPRVKLTAPKGGKKLRRRVRVKWRANDRDRDSLTYSLLYSPGEGEFVPVAAGLRGRSYEVDLRRLPGGRKARFRVVANDGVLTASATSRRGVSVKAKKPRVLISAPAADSTFSENEPIQFVAAVDDLQDATFPRRKVRWRSDKAGRIGRGATITTDLPPGLHEVTASAVNSAGKKGSATVEVRVAPTPPIIDADGFSR